MNAERMRGALTELALAFAGLVIGVVVLVVVRSFGLALELSEFVAGPAITAIAASFYVWASRRAIVRPDPPAARTRTDASAVHVVLVTALCIGLALGGSMVLGELLEILGVPVQEQPRILEIVEAAKSGEDRRTIVVLGISAVVLAPIAEETVEATAHLIAELRATPEAQEGLSAFLEKRKAAWTTRPPKAAKRPARRKR